MRARSLHTRTRSHAAIVDAHAPRRNGAALSNPLRPRLFSLATELQDTPAYTEDFLEVSMKKQLWSGLIVVVCSVGLGAAQQTTDQTSGSTQRSSSQSASKQITVTG